ncbi:MAG: glycosyltransferase [Alphaproteobacteria bacterium]|nr:glycosyltransferase [Alphaproteobacteria bacterium]
MSAGPKERLAFLLPNFRGGGAERVALTLIHDFVGRGYEVDLVLVRAAGELLDQLPSSVNLVDLGASRFVGALLPLARYLRRRRPHAVQVRMWPLTIVAILARALARSRTRLVLSDHSPLSRHYAHSPRMLRLLRWTVRLLYPRAEARILVSEGAAEDLARLSGLPRDFFTVIYNPLSRIAPPAPSAEVEELWDGCDGRIVSIGSLVAIKNHALLIDAFARLRRHRRARLLVLGAGPLLDALQAQAARLGVGEDVRFLGFVRDPAPFLASADLFALSSDFEGFGNVLVEAMWLGVDVVSTDCPTGPREILGDGAFGKLVPCGDAHGLADAMAAALRNPSPPDRLKARAAALSGPATIERYLELLLGRPATS